MFLFAEQNRTCVSNAQVMAGDPDIDQEDVAKKDRVFIHESNGKMYVARPFDLRQVELPFPDPVLAVVHHEGKNWSKNVVVIDSRSHSAATQPSFAHRLFKKFSTPATGDILKKCKEFPIHIIVMNDLTSCFNPNKHMDLFFFAEFIIDANKA